MRVAISARFLRVVAQAQHDERVAQAGEAEADAALGHGFVVLLRQRPVGHVEHVVEHADRDLAHTSAKPSKSNSAFR
jgi:hypothetical protein